MNSLLRTLALASFCGILALPTSFGAEKSVYFHLGIGGASPRYAAGSTYSGIVDTQKGAGATHVAVAVDLGAYWRTGPHILFGVSDRALADGWSNAFGVESQTISWGNLGASSMQFTGQAPGHGFFLREDLGLAYTGTAAGGSIFPTGIQMGYSAAIGGGVGIPFSESFRMLIQGQYLFGKTSDSLHAAVFTVSCLL